MNLNKKVHNRFHLFFRRIIRNIRNILILLSSLSILISCTANPPTPGNAVMPLVSLPSVSKDRTLTIEVDQISQGFNPHLRAQLSQSSLLVAALTLPSPFDEIVEPHGAITWRMRRDIFTNITSSIDRYTDTQTIVYHINPDAQWSDNAPITGDDFIYLWQQMISQPGVVNKYAYETIKDINVSGGGLTVTVHLAVPFPDWHSLFSELLPSHALRDSAAGFQTGLFLSSPLSGSYFVMFKASPDLTKIVLVRNERYWATMPPIDYIELQKMGQARDAYVTLESQPLHILMLDSSQAFYDSIKNMPGLRVFLHPMPQEMSIFLNSRKLYSYSLRKALVGALDYTSLVNSAFLGKMHLADPIAPSPSQSPPINVAGVPIAQGIMNFQHYMYTQGYIRENLSELKVNRGNDEVTAPPKLLRSDMRYSLSRVLVDKYKQPVFFVIGLANDDPQAKIVAWNLASQIARLGLIPKIRMVPASNLFGKSSQYFDAMITYDRLGYGAISDALAATNHIFYYPPLLPNSPHILQNPIKSLLSGKYNQKQLKFWQKTLLTQWNWIPLGQRNELTMIGSDILLPPFIRSTMSGSLTDMQLWNFTSQHTQHKHD